MLEFTDLENESERQLTMWYHKFLEAPYTVDELELYLNQQKLHRICFSQDKHAAKDWPIPLSCDVLAVLVCQFELGSKIGFVHVRERCVDLVGHSLTSVPYC
jgi:hypothetical protein